MDQSYPLEQGTVIEQRYVIVRKIGTGGMGSVYEAFDNRLQGSKRAVKVFHPSAHAALDGSIETGLLLQLDHPTLPIIYDYYGASDSHPTMMVMSYIAGKSLLQLLQQKYIFSFEQLLQISMQLVSALIYLHEQPIPIIHRDLKPSNVILSEQGQIKLIDFGISRYYKQGLQEDTVLLGTCGFAAPEQFNKEAQTDLRADIYGLGALLYCLWEGEAYNQARKGARAMPLQLHRNGAPQGFVELLNRMLEIDAAHRCSSMREVEARLLLLRSPIKQIEQDYLLHTNVIPCYTIAICSLYGGAGSTLFSIALAELLARRGISAAAAEFHNGPAEWDKLLPAAKLYSDLKHCGYHAKKGIGMPIHYYVKNEQQKLEHNQSLPLTEELHRQLQVLHFAKEHSRLFIIDLSDRDPDEVWHYWLQQADRIFVLADPYMSKWTQCKVDLYEEMNQKRGGGKISWVANKRERFKYEELWLSYFPRRPEIIVPLLPARELMQAVWSYSALTDHAVLRKLLQAALRPILIKLSKEIDTKISRI